MNCGQKAGPLRVRMDAGPKADSIEGEKKRATKTSTKTTTPDENDDPPASVGATTPKPHANAADGAVEQRDRREDPRWR